MRKPYTIIANVEPVAEKEGEIWRVDYPNQTSKEEWFCYPVPNAEKETWVCELLKESK